MAVDQQFVPLQAGGATSVLSQKPLALQKQLKHHKNPQSAWGAVGPKKPLTKQESQWISVLHLQARWLSLFATTCCIARCSRSDCACLIHDWQPTAVSTRQWGHGGEALATPFPRHPNPRIRHCRWRASVGVGAGPELGGRIKEFRTQLLVNSRGVGISREPAEKLVNLNVVAFAIGAGLETALNTKEQYAHGHQQVVALVAILASLQNRIGHFDQVTGLLTARNSCKNVPQEGDRPFGDALRVF
mmetsp:Transcript_96199/g.257158  ORF Transcript_96199/g.257158 Transcript_96199/m.257158 type:complete len:245 (-) Transcript_96199:680-1414(-)